MRSCSGRDDDVRRLRNLLLVDRVVLLYGRSGTGKTSLLEAEDGLRAHLLTHDHFGPIKRFYVGEYLAQASAAQPMGTMEEELKNFLDPPANWSAERAKPDDRYPLAIIDQIERCWQPGVLPSGAEPGVRLVQLLRQYILDFPRACFLLVIQEEFLASLLELRQRLPGQLGVSYRLEALTREQVKAVIAGPPGSELPAPFVAALQALGDDLAVSSQGLYDPFAVQLLGRMLEERSRGLSLGLDIAKELLDTQIVPIKRLIDTKGLVAAYLEEGLDSAVRDVPSLSSGLLSKTLQQRFLVRGSATRRIVPLEARRTRWAKWAERILRGVADLLRYARPGYELSLSFLSSVDLLSLAPRLQSWGILRAVPAATVEGTPKYELAHDRLGPPLSSLEQMELAAGALRQRRFWLLFLPMLMLASALVFLLRSRPVDSGFQGPPPTSLRERQFRVYPPGELDPARLWSPERCDWDLHAEIRTTERCVTAIRDAQARFQQAEAERSKIEAERIEKRSFQKLKKGYAQLQAQKNVCMKNLQKTNSELTAALWEVTYQRFHGDHPDRGGTASERQVLDSVNRRNLNNLCNLIYEEGVNKRLLPGGQLARQLPQLCLWSP